MGRVKRVPPSLIWRVLGGTRFTRPTLHQIAEGRHGGNRPIPGQLADLARTGPGRGIGHDVAADAIFFPPHVVCRRPVPGSVLHVPDNALGRHELAGRLRLGLLYGLRRHATDAHPARWSRPGCRGDRPGAQAPHDGVPLCHAAEQPGDRHRQTWRPRGADPVSRPFRRARAGPGHAPGRHRSTGHPVADGHHPEHGPLRDDGFHRRLGLHAPRPATRSSARTWHSSVSGCCPIRFLSC